jgi:hypothetical protein
LHFNQQSFNFETMARKFYISLLALIFFISTTSLPVSVHLCRMMGQSNAKTCHMCTAKKAAAVKMCHTKKTTETVVIKRTGSSCCSTKLIDSSVKDNYIGNAAGIKDLTPLKYLSPVIIPSDVIAISTANTVSDNIHSPPLINSNPVYLINSIFLI